MPKMIIAHAVVDIDRWLAGKAGRVSSFAPYGTNVTDLVASDGSNNVAVSVDIEDLDAFNAHRATVPREQVMADLERDGVILPPTIYIER